MTSKIENSLDETTCNCSFYFIFYSIFYFIFCAIFCAIFYFTSSESCESRRNQLNRFFRRYRDEFWSLFSCSDISRKEHDNRVWLRPFQLSWRSHSEVCFLAQMLLPLDSREPLEFVLLHLKSMKYSSEKRASIDQEHRVVFKCSEAKCMTVWTRHTTTREHEIQSEKARVRRLKYRVVSDLFDLFHDDHISRFETLNSMECRQNLRHWKAWDTGREIAR